MTAATHVLYAGRCVPIDHLPQLLHPSNAVLCRDERGQVAPGRTVPLAAIRCRVVGGDGHTISPPALPCGNGEHPGGNAAAPSGVSPHHQQASKARWS